MGVVADALEAGDVDATMFESGITPEILIDYVPLDEWWQFWRGMELPVASVQKAVAAARASRLIDDEWFLGAIEGRGGKLKGTDALAETLTKDEVIAWVRALHVSGDGSPRVSSQRAAGTTSSRRRALTRCSRCSTRSRGGFIS